jgi:hypothetical protein
VTFKARLEAMGACDQALEWVEDMTPAEAWADCPRADWLLWYARRAGTPHRLLVLAACDCARLVSSVDQPRLAISIDTVEAWARGEAFYDQVSDAAAKAAAANSTVGALLAMSALTCSYAAATVCAVADVVGDAACRDAIRARIPAPGGAP